MGLIGTISGLAAWSKHKEVSEKPAPAASKEWGQKDAVMRALDLTDKAKASGKAEDHAAAAAGHHEASKAYEKAGDKRLADFHRGKAEGHEKAAKDAGGGGAAGDQPRETDGKFGSK